MDFITQDFLDEMFSNINSYVRLSRNDKTPYELIEAKYGKEFYARIGRKGGQQGHTGGFAANPALARIAGAKGGRISKRGPAKKA